MEMIQVPALEQKITVGNVKISYNDLGDSAIPLIFIHGFPLNKSSWAPQMEYFKATNRVIAYDIRGFGGSVGNSDPVSMSIFADDLIKFMDALSIKQAIVVGLSMGGYILLNAAYSYPERFKAIILCDTQCIADTLLIKEKRNKAISQIIEGKINEYAETSLKTLLSQRVHESDKRLIETVRSMIISTNTFAMTSTLMALAQRIGMCLSLSNIKVPTLVICGAEDVITPVIQSEFLANHIVGSKIKIIEKAGHLSNLEQPQLFNEAVEQFIKPLD
jgi:3-oxoadipate enol-lactonase